MKINKYLLLPTLGMLSSVAHAQSSVTLYGSVDEGFQYTSNVGGHPLYALVSGVQQQGNRWGLKGQEDLGGGLSALFLLENGFSLNNGSALPNRQMFGRQAYVGLASNNAGAVTFGRQYDFVVDYVAPLTATGSWGGSLFEHLFDNDNTAESFRIDNSVKYTSANYAGLQFGGLYGFSNQAGAFADNRAWSVGAQYVNGPLAVGAAYMDIDNPSVNTSGAVTGSPYLSKQQRVASAGANYTIGASTLGLVYSHTEIVGRLTTPVSTLKFDNIEFNAKVNLTAQWFIAAMYGYSNVLNSFASHSSSHQNQLGLMADYRLSKRTDCYVQTAYVKESGPAILPLIGSSGGESSANNQTVARVGIRTSF
ncbi:porin [Paraburkholderia terricola]|uniref:Porin n=1 Tax=Paraburkholderia terricola TaxID=169427 RepID=A0ABU1M2F6_9BURK|nr:porin [Paraburkholderia terricola]MDR6413044.1 putative porin [Paraburkholderia terricola]MDR6485358.1 putative porin [Paraburkholderia terricola]